ncbi:hypothetical protein CPB86DRAFT_162563 [Serendipita vermifera]|nr:hypothetical protein CPB86DRAFT_162563 [Serendipita vermifera]
MPHYIKPAPIPVAYHQTSSSRIMDPRQQLADYARAISRSLRNEILQDPSSGYYGCRIYDRRVDPQGRQFWFSIAEVTGQPDPITAERAAARDALRALSQVATQAATAYYTAAY